MLLTLPHSPAPTVQQHVLGISEIQTLRSQFLSCLTQKSSWNIAASYLNASFKARFSSCYAKGAYKKGKDSKVQGSTYLICKSSQVQHEGMHNAQDYMPIRKMGKPLMIFKARVSLVISIWLLFLGDLKIPFIRECFPIISSERALLLSLCISGR